MHNDQKQLPEDVLRYIKFLERKNDDVRTAYQESVKEVVDLFNQIKDDMIGIPLKTLFKITPMSNDTKIHDHDHGVVKGPADILNMIAEKVREWEKKVNAL